MNLKTFYKVRDGEKGQIICFPYLGGYVSSFRELVQALPEEIEIWVANPPGHLGSQLELISDIEVLIAEYYKEISLIIRPKSTFFGHSMGGIVSYFLLQKMFSEKNQVLPETLILSACVAPSSFWGKDYTKLNDADLIEQIKEYGGMPDVVLQDKVLMEVMIPIFRADYGILETSAKLSCHEIDIDVQMLWGEKDKAEKISSARLWKDFFMKDFDIIPIQDGEHMYIHNKAEQVAFIINQFIKVS